MQVSIRDFRLAILLRLPATGLSTKKLDTRVVSFFVLETV